jgi:putative salt-induced outer membrane protein YdiY
MMKRLFTGTILALLLATTGSFAETNQAAVICTEHLAICPKCGFTETNQVVSATEAETNVWELSVYGGFAAKSGNTTSSSYNYGGEFHRDGKVYRGELKLDGSYSKTEEQVTTSQSEASGELRRMLNENWFAYGTLSALHDEIKDLSYRMRTGPGMGYYFVDSEELTADISSGPLYVCEKKAGYTSGYLAWRFAQGIDWQITDTLRWWVLTEADVDTTDTAAYIITFKTGIENKINSNLSLIVVLKDDYDSQPEISGRIKKNDMEISTGLRYAF